MEHRPESTRELKAGERFSFGRAFVRGELHLGFWSFANKGAGALGSFFILSSLSVYQFGVYQLLLSLYGTLSDVFHDVFGSVMANDIARFIGERKEDRAKRMFAEYAVFRLVLAGVPWAAIFFGSPLFSARFGPDTIAILRLTSFLFFADLLVIMATLLLSIRLEFAALAPRSAVQKFLQFAIIGGFYFFGHLGIFEIFTARLASTVAAVALMAPALVRSIRPWHGIAVYNRWLSWRVIRSYGKWALPQGLMSDFTGKIRPWLIKFFLNTEAVGIFGIASMFISALKDLIPIRTPGLLIPHRIKDPALLERFYRYGTKYCVWFTVLLCFAAAGGVPLAIRVLFPKFVPALPLFYLMLISVLMFAFIKPMSSFLIAFRRQKFIFLQGGFQNALWLAVMVFTLPTIGILGLAIADVVSSAAGTALRYGYLIRTGLVAPFSLRALVTFDDEDRANLALVLRHLRFSFRWT